MGSFLGESNPDFVLFGTLGREQGKDGHDDENKYNAQLDIRPCLQALEHDRFIVADDLPVHADGIASLHHTLSITLQMSSIFNITIIAYDSFVINDNDRNGIVSLQHIGNQRDVCCLVGLVQSMQGLCPHFHSALFFFRQVAHEEMGNQQ